MQFNFIYNAKIQDFKDYLQAQSIECNPQFGGQTIVIEDELSDCQIQQIRSFCEICNQDKPISYKTDMLIYYEIAGSFTDQAQADRIESAFSHLPFFGIFLRSYDYASAVGKIEQALAKGLIIQADHDLIIGVIPNP